MYKYLNRDKNSFNRVYVMFNPSFFENIIDNVFKIMIHFIMKRKIYKVSQGSK